VRCGTASSARPPRPCGSGEVRPGGQGRHGRGRLAARAAP
jgi:hypothetical protein